jgi:hypothetical protein
MSSQDSQTAAKPAADTILCKMGCGFFVSFVSDVLFIPVIFRVGVNMKAAVFR